MSTKKVEIYTDGSCNPKYQIGVWAAFVFYNGNKYILHGIDPKTTHNRMELIGVINSIEYTLKNIPEFSSIKVFTDSQYVVELPNRAKKLVSKEFKTNSGNTIQNADLVKKLIQLVNLTNTELIKVRAHQKESEEINYNREVDKFCRKLLRQHID